METKISKENDDTTLKVIGRLDTTNAGEFEIVIQQFIKDKELSLIVDLSELTYISSSGLRCFILLLKSMTANNNSLVLENLRPEIKEVFDMTGFTKLFNIK